MSNDCDSNKRESSSSSAAPALLVPRAENEASQIIAIVFRANRWLFDGCDRSASACYRDTEFDSANFNRPVVERKIQPINGDPLLLRSNTYTSYLAPQSSTSFATSAEKSTRPRGYVLVDRQEPSQSFLR